MMDFSQPVLMHDIEDVDPRKLMILITNYCLDGKPIHKDSLTSCVFKLIQISRNLELEQLERDAAATLATGLANAAITAYGANSEFGSTLMSGIQSLLDKRH